MSSRIAVRYGSTRAMPVREATIEELLEIIGMSVSAMNLQPWKIKVVRDQETKDKVFAATFGMNQVKACSHLLVMCADTDYPTLIIASCATPRRRPECLRRCASACRRWPPRS